ncbi:similar to Saccharomyces cerevisiae YDR390C UBA2 Subunit of a heterodimeric nuclear SUMO activating enzyme (E1) with Aos1p [Maudiozyma barnettii]|uniref:Ubiquitin-activating enzyme E1-like n=1 Tax=Maudiozyma barnettii TaxID=61262 RepID=A0A8H2VDW1_9SACH|nr:E1 ubiquitin-activating protein UBA2 [Kazachstania barnettii]CAB4253731.1 similar to Saccharomyces cerevisiae YDR390C UBA2 Subunit of a heterodimeric nuclear SUMO activating enzyme (E1) with Aos1p [Kazachstania barnettii]CAD1781479.1 similar to Saccharomyces cerevisiae YDR390C UBA2 Subunit of a heterodimeric nuclear SUMO activating enzyme (E1) with Aos1p [Kazachstania barnettii]
MSRDSNITKIIGEENLKKLRATKCLLIGAGGIGSELLKDLILMEFGEIHLVDLDTIDLSNLNRQFLFRQRDIKQPKSTTAVKAVQGFNNSKLVPYEGNIMDTSQFPLHWFGEFDIIFNALDNLAARRYVNKMSQFLSIPLLESGTSGFDGYMQPIIPNETECFDCTKKETPKTFPVCTIRSTPSQPIHCIVWAKNFLFAQLFAADVAVNNDSENKDWGTTDEDEIKRIKQETNELQELQDIILSGDTTLIPNIIEKIFIHDIEKLLRIENLWKTRTRPTPLNSSQITTDLIDRNLDLSALWPIQDQIQKFSSITSKLMKRMKEEDNHIEFDKDDEDTLEFVSTAANIRSQIFNIPLKSVFDIKQIAGNIIPAIATTNAIIAGLSSLVSLRVLSLLDFAKITKPTDLNMVFTAKASNISQNRYLSNPTLAKPNCNCPVCSKVVRGVMNIQSDMFKHLKLKDLIITLSEKYNFDTEELSILDTTGQRLLSDFDFDSLDEKTLEEIKVLPGSVILVTDETEDNNGMGLKPLELYIESRKIDSRKTSDIELPDIKIPFVKMTTAEEEHNESSTQETPVLQTNEVITLDMDDNDKDIKKRKLSDESSEATQNKKSKQEEDDIEIIEEDDIIELD